MLRYLRSELFRLRRRRMTLVLVVLMAVIPVILYAVLYASAQAQLQLIRSGAAPPAPGQTEEAIQELLDMLRPNSVPTFGLGIVAAIGTVLAIVLAGSVTGNEFGWATIRTVLAHGGRRASFLLAKVVALVAVTAVIVLVGFVSAFGASYAVSITAGLDLATAADLPSRTLGDMARTLYVTLPYIAFAVLMSVVARSAASGIAFGLVLSFGESLVGQLAVAVNRDLQALFDAGIARNVAAITRTQQTTSFSSPEPLSSDLWLSALILALYTVAFLALAVDRLAKRDVTLA